MKIKHSLFNRREFLNWLLGGWVGVFVVSLVSPIAKFIFPPYQEPDKVALPLVDFKDLEPGALKNFPWGAKPAFIRKNGDGSYLAIVGVCTHLDCNVTYLADQKKFFCACHDGWYDENGLNISGPPPRPLRKLRADVDGENLVVKKEGVA
jgi:Rieske Fe-S protein